MKTNDIMNKLSRSVHRVGLKIRKHSPEILMVTGVVGVVTSTVLACKATRKLDEIMNESKQNLEVIHAGMEQKTIVDEKGVAHTYSEEDGKKDLTITYVQTGVKIARLYAPAVLVGVTSIGCLLASNDIMRKRNVALAAAYTAVDNSFKNYRNNVIERFGEKLDKELRYNIKVKEIEKRIQNEDGTETVVKEKVEVTDGPNKYSEFARIFDDGCKGWTKDPETNLMTVTSVQRWANQKLKTDSYLFLNDVYDALGFQRTKLGQMVGWVYDEEVPVGDNYVDFGIYDIHSPKARDFVNGYERNIVLDFNVDGVILDILR